MDVGAYLGHHYLPAQHVRFQLQLEFFPLDRLAYTKL